MGSDEGFYLVSSRKYRHKLPVTGVGEHAGGALEVQPEQLVHFLVRGEEADSAAMTQ